MRRLVGVAVLAVLAGCGGSGGTKAKHPDGASDGAGAGDHPAEAQGGEADAPADAGIESAPDVGAEAWPDAPGGEAGGGGGAGGESGDASGEVGDAASEAADGGHEDEVEAAAPRLVTVAFTGQVITVVDTPLGFDSMVRLEPVSGSFTYDPAMADDLPNDPKSGRYQRGGTTAFTFTVKGHTVTGSGTALLETQNMSSDTFRFRDGPQGDTVPRVMKLDGVAAPAIVLYLAITDNSGAMLTSDALPDPFPTVDIANKNNFDVAHTFSIMDGGGTLLMKLATLAQQ
jgi:hypothetical protein